MGEGRRGNTSPGKHTGSKADIFPPSDQNQNIFLLKLFFSCVGGPGRAAQEMPPRKGEPLEQQVGMSHDWRELEKP